MNQKVLILGAAGFVGQRLFKHFQTSDWAFPIAAHRSPKKLPTQPAIQTLQCDATDFEQLKCAAKGIELIVNCVVGSAATITDNAESLAKLATFRPDIRIVHLSSMAVYGAAIGEVNEDSELRSDMDSYSRKKSIADQLLLEAGAIVLRPGIIYGCGSRLWTERIYDLLLQKRLGDLGPGGDGICNLVYVDDVAKAVEQALLLPRSHRGVAFNLVAPNQPTWNEYFVEFAKAFGETPVKRIGGRKLFVEGKIFAIPLKILELSLERLGQLNVSSPKPIAPSQLRLFKQRIWLSNKKASNILRITWTPLSTGLVAIRKAKTLDHPS